jgi:mannose-6-phosphate isomerase
MPGDRNARRLRGVYPLDPWIPPPVIWGGSELQRAYGKNAPADARLGESWEVSCVADRESRIRGTDVTLASAFAADPGHFLGDDRGGSASFPLLVKLLATSAFLSVQVHPNDEQAARLEGSSNGKHEAWVVLHAVASAEVLAGLRPGATAEDLFEAAISGSGNRVRDLLLSHKVSEGDVVEVPPGCVHATGPGLVLYEVQQPVDLTYRIFDWGRTGLDGKPRPLHVDKARQVVDPAARPGIGRGRAERQAGDGSFKRLTLIASRPFAIERWNVTGHHRMPTADLLLVTCVDGRGTLVVGDDAIPLDRGQSCVVPAMTPEVAIDGSGLDLLVAARS